MSNKVDQKAYLQKYLSGSSGDKKKKKKKTTKGKGFKIIDDDIDLSKLRPLDGDDLDIFDEGEDAPQIAGIIDERPEELKQLEALKTSSKWKVVSQDDGFNSKLKVEEIKKDIKETEIENELIFGKMYSDSEDEVNNDAQGLKKDSLADKKKDNEKVANSKQRHADKSIESSKKHRRSSGSDQSPPRRTRQSPDRRKNRREPDSPSRRQKHSESNRKTSSHNNSAEYSKKRRNSSDSDQSPPRKRNKSPGKIIKKYNNDSDQSPPRNTRKSPERKRSRWAPLSPDNVKQSQSKQNYNHKSSSNNNQREGLSKKRYSSDSDQSPPRKTRKSPERNRKKDNDDSDNSPPRKARKFPEKSRRKDSYDSDQSPPRRTKNASNRNNNSPPPTNKKMARTLDGKMAGLQDARQLRQENDDFRRRENEVFNKMSDEVSGRNAKAVSRKAKRETSAERQKKTEKAERQKEIDEKYKKWSRGIKQIQEQEDRVQEFMHESSKPLARHKGDRDLEMSLKEIERDGDPMLKYIRDKKRERGELGPEKPSYKGSFPPNRFNIRPGYRWDGVDRSNGYEKKYFEQQSKRKAQQEEAYKWSTEDL